MIITRRNRRHFVAAGGSVSLLAQVQAMFGGGENGLIYDAGDAANLFQERTGTPPATPSGPDGPVGSIKDLSPNNNWGRAPSDAARPLWRASGYFETDGIDDLIETTYSRPQPRTRISYVRLIAGSDRRLFGGAASDNYALYQRSATQVYSIFAGAQVSTLVTTLDANLVFTEQYNGVSSRVAVGNAAYVTGSAGVGTATSMRIAVDSVGVAFAAMRVYRVVEISRLLSDAEIAVCKQFVEFGSSPP